ncbi:hypothetical protein LTR47_006970 [Exophiala xenobiotica]|nr:hypothetical protein LTR47_006970 [Exophiala xenobiotica]KAK5283234.1 hypothetical protein LTR40_002072 [Exophiala xenobiotica]KAK5353653.1 hypothetical protein LTR61_002347 [Exophiala xenobiotica]KAK5370462.1 hypothetical protein LTR11_006673 [Exophiala xenobiotica]
MYEYALSGLTRALGPDHIHAIGAVNNLANLYCEQGKVLRAQELYNQALVGITEKLGPAHYFVWGVTNNLGLCYAMQGNFDLAHQIYQAARNGFHKSLGPEHPHTKMVCYNLKELELKETQIDLSTHYAGATGSVDRPRRMWYY